VSPILPPRAVVRISLANFDPKDIPKVEAMTLHTGKCLIPAIKRLPGLAGYFAGASPTGSMVHVSLWESDAHAQQMGNLKEMIVDARQAAEAVGLSFIPIVNYPIAWQI